MLTVAKVTRSAPGDYAEYRCAAAANLSAGRPLDPLSESTFLFRLDEQKPGG